MSENSRLNAAEESADFASVLGALPFFHGLDAAALAAISEKLEWFSLPGGAVLFRQGEEPDALYIVASGSLCALVETGEGKPLLVGRIGVGETVGEMALISGHRRSATVRATRDCELLRFDRADFEALISSHPRAMLHLTRVVVQRLEQANSNTLPLLRSRSFAVLPHGPETNTTDFGRELVSALSAFGQARLVSKEEAADQTSDWFHQLEARYGFIVYEADWQPTAWTRLCLRQADALILVAKALHEPSSFPALGAISAQRAADRRMDLVLLHEGYGPPVGTAAWLALQPVEMHHHVRNRQDTARLARILTGRGIGLVLSGGGARGFAHIGVVQALREAKLPIDLVGGTSMGAIVAAGVASDWSDEEMRQRYWRCFVSTNPLGDFTLPIVSLVSGRKVSRLLHGEFGSVQIEDLPRPYFCLSANLTKGTAAVHRSGLLWRWLRASVAIPGILPPVFDHGEVYVDAGAMNNLPVDVMRLLSGGPVIAVDVGGDQTFVATGDEMDMPPFWRLLWRRRGTKRPNIFQILWRAGTVSGGAHAQLVRGQADLLLQPPMQTIDMLNWKSFDRAIEAGYRDACEQLTTNGPRLLQKGGVVLV